MTYALMALQRLGSNWKNKPHTRRSPSMQHLMNLDIPQTRTTPRGLTLTWTRCRLYVGPERLADEETPITCPDCLRTALDSIEVPLVHPAPQPSATDQWAYIERLRQATGKAQQAVLPGIGD